MTVHPTTTIAAGELQEDRFSRLRLIPWWDQEKIRATRVLVVGAGALGNEILKNLVLLGFQQIVIVDPDRIEESNLSRTILYRSEDVGQFKADVAARSVANICPGGHIRSLVGNVMHDCGLGLFAWSDLIFAGLDNREARLWINRSAWKMNRPWIDGAIEGINGIARVFLPGSPPCYECTLGETDWKLLEKRMSCNLLARQSNVEGKVPTTPTISSIIAGIQVQEGVKLIHGLPTLASRGYMFEGLNHTSYLFDYTENPDCMSHYTHERVVEISLRSCELTLQQLRKRAQEDLGTSDVTIEFSRDIIHKLVCPKCHGEEERFASLGSINVEEGRCPQDGEMRIVVTAHGFAGSEEFGERMLDRLGLPRFDAFVGRTPEQELVYLISGDRGEVLGSQGLAAGR
ncbi:MAG: molybdopterin biosynthesis protein MoeB [Acidobacteria bacterium]|nr:MAG: molybdopterin biosynthesis protein MoeB [Acidobacteriota bacterium]